MAAQPTEATPERSSDNLDLATRQPVDTADYGDAFFFDGGAEDRRRVFQRGDIAANIFFDGVFEYVAALRKNGGHRRREGP